MTPRSAFLAALEATWPAAEVAKVGPWLLRRGLGGGKRVSAASAIDAWQDSDIALAEAGMAAFGQTALFVLAPEDTRLDQALAARGYGMVDPVTILAAPVATMAAEPPAPMTSFAHWPGLTITEDIWQTGGVGPARLAVMARVAGPKTVLLGRSSDRAAGTAFVAAAGHIAMVHAVEVLPAHRRQGVARNLMRGAAVWAAENGAETLALAVTDANLPARALYASFGMQAVGQYHYRARPDGSGVQAG